MNYTTKLCAALCAVLGMACFSSGSAWAGEPAWWTKQKRDCGLPSDLAYNNWNGQCGGSANNSPAPAVDYEAERRQQEAAAAAAAAAAERRIKEEAERQAAFIRSRDEAASTLKGSIGTSSSPNNGGLKGSSDYGLKGAVSDHGLKGSTTPASGQSKQVVAGKKPCPAMPNTDASVVDARCVPRDGAYLTAQVPELARSPAADRITKGFQAVIKHDWPAALAWWKDALQRDPANAALKRSVDLAQWMVDRRKATAAGPVTPPLSIAIQAASRGDNAEAIRQFEIVKADNPASAPYVDSMIAEIRKKSERAVRQATENYKFEQMLRAYAQDTFDEGLSKLTIGDEKGAQEAFDKADYLSRSLPAEQRPYPLPPDAKPKP